MRVLIDTNIYLDIALQREPFARNSIATIKRIISSGIVLYAPHSLATTSYLCEKQLGKEVAFERVTTLLEIVQIGKFDHEDALISLRLNQKDFEDGMILATALANEADCIVSRNCVDFQGSDITVLTPEEFLEDVR